MKKKKVMLRIVTVLFVLFTFTRFVQADGQEDAMVRLLHASPDAPQVDIAVDGDLVVESFDFKEATDYLYLAPGEYTVEIFPAGDQNSAVLSQNLTVDSGQAYTVAAINKLENLDLKVIEDASSTTEGKAWVRVGHLSPDAPNVDVAANGDIVFSDAPYPAVTDYEEFDPTTVDLDVRVAGTEDVVLTLPDTELQADTLYTVIAVGLVEGDPELDAIVLADPSMDQMPSEMPATGMGGASPSTSDFTTAGGILMILISLGAIFFLFQNQPWNRQSEN
ncbi:DUF4397 domain-containing protein [Salipaludibacillus keqinensis]|nr:DUF4397 domain-containing protein [Salipaludibacillus keqinensis]